MTKFTILVLKEVCAVAWKSDKDMINCQGWEAGKASRGERLSRAMEEVEEFAQRLRVVWTDEPGPKTCKAGACWKNVLDLWSETRLR